MKKTYQHPVMKELLLRRKARLLAGSYFRKVNTESGGEIDPETEVDTGL